MSHHFDSPTAIADGRLNLCDLYVFPDAADTSTLILTTNPDAGRSSPTTFRPDALYEFVIATEEDAVDERALRMVFSDIEPDGRQQMRVLYADGEQSRRGVDGSQLGAGTTDDVFSIGNGGRAWFGSAADPFWADGAALGQFMSALDAGDYRPELIGDEPSNIFAGRNVTAIALQVPNSILSGPSISLWARISLYGHAPQRQVSRIGNPMLRPLFFRTPGPEVEELNAGSPTSDVDKYAAHLTQVAARLATLRDFDQPAAHAEAVARAFLPDVLHIRPRRPANYHPGTGNGRALHDDAFGTALSVLNGSPLGITPSPHRDVPTFPHLLPANHDDMPSLADLFGLRQLEPAKHEI